MDLLIVNSGLEAAHSAGLSGPRVNAITVKLGDAIYTPAVGMTDIQGTLLHTASVNSFTVINANLVEYEVVLDETVGDFTFNEVGLFLDSGELFALGVSSTPIFKQQQVLPSIIGNRVILRLQVQFSNITNVLDFTLVTSGTLSEYANNIKTATFVNSTTFTMVDNQTVEYHPGRKLKASQTSGEVYSHIKSSTFGGGLTTVVIDTPVLDSSLFAVDHGTISGGIKGALPKTLLGEPRTITTTATPGQQGEVAYNSMYLFVWVDDNVCHRTPLSSF